MLPNYKVELLVDYRVDFEERIGNFPFMKSKQKLLIEEFGMENYKILETLKYFSNMKGIQARLPYVLEIH